MQSRVDVDSQEPHVPALEAQVELPPSIRTAWVSDLAAEVWRPILQGLQATWRTLERSSVLAGIRPCSLEFVPQAELPARTAAAMADGQTLLPLGAYLWHGGTYMPALEAAKPGVPSIFRSVRAAPDVALQFKAAWDDSDDDEIGRLLGYPECCRSFFRTHWDGEKQTDPSLQQARRTSGVEEEGGSYRVPEPAYQTNVLLRWLGIRAVPHLPCSYSCPDSVQLSDEILGHADEAGLSAQAQMLRDVLAWPMEWSALHGALEVRTPVMKLSATTDYTSQALAIQLEGSSWPAEGSSGLRFPYKRPATLRVSGSRSFKTAPSFVLSHLRTTSDGTALHEDNGFSDLAAMRRRHELIASLVVGALGSSDGPAVLDLGCGNGALLASLRARVPGLRVCGVEYDGGRADRGREAFDLSEDELLVGNILSLEAPWEQVDHYDIVMLAVNRLLEAKESERDWLLANIRRKSSRLLLYTYDGSEKPGALIQRAEEAHVLVPREDVSGFCGWAELAVDGDEGD